MRAWTCSCQSWQPSSSTSAAPPAILDLETHLHGQLSAEIVAEHVRTVGLPPSAQKLVLDAIADHPLRNDQVRDTYVVRVLQDADRLDTLGAVGAVRCGSHRWWLPLFTGDEPTSVEEPALALVSIYQDFAVRVPAWYDCIWTDTARAIAKPRIQFLRTFIAQFREEADCMMESFHLLGI